MGNQHLLEVVAIYFYFLMELGACMSRWMKSTDAKCRINPQGKEKTPSLKTTTIPKKPTPLKKQKTNAIVEVKNYYNVFLT